MANRNTLDVLKQCFEKVVPANDERAGIGPLSFVVCLVHSYLGDAKTNSLEAIRRFTMKHTGKKIARSSFWERLTTARLQRFLSELAAEMMARLNVTFGVSKTLLGKLGVSGIRLLDSSSITLRKGARWDWPGTRTKAGIKWHLVLDVLSGRMVWFRLTPTRTSDHAVFPEISSLVGQLIIFDLGYGDYGLLLDLKKAGAFFLSRVKSNAVITVKEVVEGLPKGYAGNISVAQPASWSCR